MGATNHTTNYNLPQFVGSDKPTWLGDFNSAMSAIDTQMKANDTLANTAKTTADTALINSSTAQTTANNAQTKADKADTTANSALNKALQNETDVTNLKTSITHSTNEIVVGTWIDGKPIYRKTLTSIGNTGENVGLAHGVPDIGALIKSDIFCTNNEGRSYPAHNDIFDLYVKTSDTTNVWCNISSGFADTAWKVNLTIEYTKTSDNV